MSTAEGTMPRGGFAPMVCELHVDRLEDSLAFWCGILGFAVAYRRVEEGFVYLDHEDGPQIMLCRRHGRFETAAMEQPFGRGVMLQVYVRRIEPVLAAAQSQGWPLYQPVREVWRRTGPVESGQREVFLQDPDGYLVMVAAPIGERPPSGR